MPDLARVLIRNYQSHASTEIEPAPAGQLTVIVGPSDVGKSAILRALRWLLYNRPQGDEFRRVGTDFTSVTVETSDGHTVTRSRSAGTNRYVVDGAILEGFGHDVPLEVRQATGVRVIEIAGQEIEANLARQLEAPFLGSGTSGPARAKALGTLAGVDVVDRASRDLGTELHRARQETKRLESETQTLQGRLAEYEHLPRLAEALEALRRIAAEVEAAQERREILGGLRDRLANAREQIATAEREITSLAGVKRAAALLREAEQDAARLDRLSGLQTRLHRVRADIEAAERESRAAAGADRALAILGEAARALDRLDRLAAAKERLNATWEQILEASMVINRLRPAVDIDLHSAEAMAERYQRLVALDQGLRRARDQVQAEAKAGQEAAARVAAIRREYEVALLAAGVCPTCGSPVREEHLREVV